MAISGLGESHEDRSLQIKQCSHTEKMNSLMRELEQSSTQAKFEERLASKEFFELFRIDMLARQPQVTDEKIERVFHQYCRIQRSAFNRRNTANNPATIL